MKQTVPADKPLVFAGDMNGFDSAEKEAVVFKKLIDNIVDKLGVTNINALFKLATVFRFFPWPYDIRFRLSAENLNKLDEQIKNESDPDKVKLIYLNMIMTVPELQPLAGLILDYFFAKNIDLTKVKLSVFGLDENMTHEELLNAYVKAHSEGRCWPVSDHPFVLFQAHL